MKLSITEVIEKKLKYYKQQKERALTNFMENNKQSERMGAIRCTEKCKCYEEILVLLKEQL